MKMFHSPYLAHFFFIFLNEELNGSAAQVDGIFG